MFTRELIRNLIGGVILGAINGVMEGKHILDQPTVSPLPSQQHWAVAGIGVATKLGAKYSRSHELENMADGMIYYAIGNLLHRTIINAHYEATATMARVTRTRTPVRPAASPAPPAAAPITRKGW